jgi:ubiquinone/menaquinone biosynthesis C-methylase UbiE
MQSMESIRRFDGKVTDYAHFRESYSSEIRLPILQTSCGLTPTWVVADIGAGTGMLSDVFRANGNRTLAVEPNAEMRQMCRSLHESDPKLQVIEGTAEETGLESSSVDLVTAGRAMHWFDRERAFTEFRRILKPDGWVAIVAFGRTEKGREENVVFEQLLRAFSPDHADTHAGYEVYRRLRSDLPRDFYHQEILGTMSLGWEDLLGLTLSLSHSPARESQEYVSFEDSLREFFQRFASDGQVALETRYWINVGRFERARTSAFDDV